MVAVAHVLDRLCQGVDAIRLRANDALELDRLRMGARMDLLQGGLEASHCVLQNLQAFHVRLLVSKLLHAALDPVELLLHLELDIVDLLLGAAGDLLQCLFHDRVLAHELLDLAADLALSLLEVVLQLASVSVNFLADLVHVNARMAPIDLHSVDLLDHEGQLAIHALGALLELLLEAVVVVLSIDLLLVLKIRDHSHDILEEGIVFQHGLLQILQLVVGASGGWGFHTRALKTMSCNSQARLCRRVVGSTFDSSSSW